MQLRRGLHNVPRLEQGRAVTIGNFDGVHLGHQQVLRRLIAEAQRIHAVSSVIIFEPQPMEYFIGDRAPARLMRWHDKVQELRRIGVDEVIVLPFNKSLQSRSADDFARNVLHRCLGARLVLMGDDFRFGCDRQGDVSFLRNRADQLEMEVLDSASVCQAGERISSTLLRTLLAEGKMETVANLLGRSYSISGRVMVGDQLGRTLGFPTANILLRRQVSPLSGVFTVEVHTGHRTLPGVANVGRRPTVGGTQMRLEVHLLDVHLDLYGVRLEVVFLHQLRREQKFASLEELKAAIAADVAQSRRYFQERYH